MAWHVLRGKPLMYRIGFAAPTHISNENQDAWLLENRFTGTGIETAITFEGGDYGG